MNRIVRLMESKIKGIYLDQLYTQELRKMKVLNMYSLKERYSEEERTTGRNIIHRMYTSMGKVARSDLSRDHGLFAGTIKTRWKRGTRYY